MTRRKPAQQETTSRTAIQHSARVEKPRAEGPGVEKQEKERNGTDARKDGGEIGFADTRHEANDHASDHDQRVQRERDVLALRAHNDEQGSLLVRTHSVQQETHAAAQGYIYSGNADRR